MNDRTVCLLRDNFGLIPLGQTVVYGENLLKFTREYRDILEWSTPPEKSME